MFLMSYSPFMREIILNYLRLTVLSLQYLFYKTKFKKMVNINFFSNSKSDKNKLFISFLHYLHQIWSNVFISMSTNFFLLLIEATKKFKN